MACNTVLPTATLVDGTLDVTSKFKSLSEAALATDSIYMRAKDTFKELFDGRNISTDEYAQLAGQFVSQLAVANVQQVMQGALQWATQEKEMAYSLAQSKASTENILAQRDMVGHQICKIDKEVELACAQLEATIAGSIRDNGTVLTYDAGGCKPTALYAEGTKHAQELLLASQKYTTLADTYRKSGVVTIGTTVDGVEKGTTGDLAGYTDAQEKFARRQILSFEDSKRSHAANAISQMMGQLLAAEIPILGTTYETNWNTALNYLNTNTPA